MKTVLGIGCSPWVEGFSVICSHIFHLSRTFYMCHSLPVPVSMGTHVTSDNVVTSAISKTISKSLLPLFSNQNKIFFNQILLMTTH